MLIVQKYGGSSLANNDRVFNVANRIIETYKEGHKVVVVLSAQGKTTDNLLKRAYEVNSNPSKRELDALLATGEQQSISLMCMALHSLGYNAVSLSGPQVGILTTSVYGDSRIKEVYTERINKELEKNNIVIVAGFQGENSEKDITTLGRGGSDTTAVAVAASLKADKCEIYTDVNGVYTADPRIVKNAKKLDSISYDEMLELANVGAKVLHNRSVEMAKKYNVTLVVKSSFTNEEGTTVCAEKGLENNTVNGLAIDKNVARVSVIGSENRADVMFNIFSALSEKNINVDIISQSIAEKNTVNISFTVERNTLEETVLALEEKKDTLKFKYIDTAKEVAKLSIVGSGMDASSGVATKLFQSLFDSNTAVDLVSTSEIKITVLIEDKVIDNVANIVHDKFFCESDMF